MGQQWIIDTRESFHANICIKNQPESVSVGVDERLDRTCQCLSSV